MRLLFFVPEVAKIIRGTENEVYRLVHEGVLQGRQRGRGPIKITRGSLCEYLDVPVATNFLDVDNDTEDIASFTTRGKPAKAKAFLESEDEPKSFSKVSA